MKQDTIKFLNNSIRYMKDGTFSVAVEVKDRKALHVAMQSKFSPIPAGANETESFRSFLQWMQHALSPVIKDQENPFGALEDGFTISNLPMRAIFAMVPCWIRTGWMFSLQAEGIDGELTNIWTPELNRHHALTGSSTPMSRGKFAAKD